MFEFETFYRKQINQPMGGFGLLMHVKKKCCVEKWVSRERKKTFLYNFSYICIHFNKLYINKLIINLGLLNLGA